MSARALWCFMAVVAIAGCSRQEAVSCNTDVRYSTASSAPPVQIPDDLSPPDESDALRLPPPVGTVSSPTAGPCLQSPPSFFGDSRPFQRDPDVAQPARTPAEPARAPAEQSAPNSAADDRVIDN